MMNKKVCLRCGHQWAARTRNPVQCPACHSAYWSRNPVERVGGGESRYGLSYVVRELNRVQAEGRISGDWVIYGSVAYALWMLPLTTYDIDVMIPPMDDRGYGSALRAIKEATGGKGEGFAVVIGDVRVEVFPANMSPLYEDAYRTAVSKAVEGGTIKIVRPEHLTLMAIAAWRRDSLRGVDDPQRATNLIASGVCNQGKLRKLVDDYADTFPRVSGTEIRTRLNRVLGMARKGAG